MSPVLHLLWVALLCLISGMLAVPVLNQTPVSGPVSAGQTARLESRIQNGSVGSCDFGWDRHRPGKRPEGLIGHTTGNNIYRGPGITERFQPSRDTSANSHILTICNLEPGDSAVYYCRVWESGVAWFYGPGTILEIKSSESRKPSVLLLPPSPEETGSGSATLFCLVSGFKPGLVALRWSVDGVETDSGVTAGAVSLDTDQTYRLSSYLRVLTAAWNKGSNYSCSVSHSSLSSPLRKTISSSACSQPSLELTSVQIIAARPESRKRIGIQCHLHAFGTSPPLRAAIIGREVQKTSDPRCSFYHAVVGILDQLHSAQR
ncbi:immunoglobulin lambda-1 light chain-like [Hypanus sabinus]|uniref:immunoglobulin lambda-1 light chain-like n=1 Tax=Hypanus sabinus TaxID=79690 RepID=UPI0028C4A461|nr:immunoglobulin lambda-1 light chain-like [Hypanus sabinus]